MKLPSRRLRRRGAREPTSGRPIVLKDGNISVDGKRIGWPKLLWRRR